MEVQWDILFLAPTGGKVAVGRIGGAGWGGVGSAWGDRLQIVYSYAKTGFHPLLSAYITAIRGSERGHGQ